MPCLKWLSSFFGVTRKHKDKKGVTPYKRTRNSFNFNNSDFFFENIFFSLEIRVSNLVKTKYSNKQRVSSANYPTQKHSDISKM